MGFNFERFAGGFAGGATAQYKAQDKEKKDAIASKRSLIFNATTDIYATARLAKKETDAQVKEDKKYLSGILSMDPTISKDNQKKLLSLDKDRRLQAESELTYRRTDDANASFNSFMSYVDKPEKLDNTVGLDAAYQNSLTVPPKAAVAYYDKSGLITDSEVRTIYGEVASVMSEVYGYSPAQARAISTQATNDLKFPPIKIDWSESIVLKDNEKKNAALMLAANATNNAKLSQQLVNANITTTKEAITALEAQFATTYETVKMTKDGEVVLDDDDNPVMHRPGANFASISPNYGVDFRNSAEYNKLAVRSMTPAIIAMKTNPAANTKSSMDYISATFPGMYGDTVDLSEGTREDKAKIVLATDPAKVYHVKGGLSINGAEKGYVFLGAQLHAFYKPKGNDTGNGTGSTPKVSVVSKGVEAAEEALRFGIEMNASEESILQLEEDIVEAKKEVDRGIRKDEYKTFKAETVKKEAVSKITFEPDATQWSTWDKNLDVAIKAGDKEQVQEVLDFYENNKPNKPGGSNMALPFRIMRRAHAALEDIRIENNPTLKDTLDKINKVLPGSLLTKANRIPSKDAKAFLKKLATYPEPENADELAELNKVKKELYRNI